MAKKKKNPELQLGQGIEKDGSIIVDLPLPTSTNRLWRSGRTKAGIPYVYLAPVYQKWKDRADGALLQQLGNYDLPAMIEGPFNAELTITVKKRFKLDLDNRAKGTLDWAKRIGLILDDKFQNSLTIMWGDAPLGARLKLTAVPESELVGAL